VTGVLLTLSDEERQLLREILEGRQRTLLREISRADHREFKVALQKKAELLESLLRRFMVHRLTPGIVCRVRDNAQSHVRVWDHCNAPLRWN